MSLKQDAKAVVLNLFGPINAERVEAMDDSNPTEFLDKVKKTIIAPMLGDSAAEKSLANLYAMYKK